MAQALLATVGSPGNTQTVTLPLFDPRWVREHRARLRFDSPPELALANSLYIASGRWPARGWILLKRGDYNQITNLFRTDFQLQINDFSNPQLTFQNLAIVQARCVTKGVSADPNAIYLVELTDHQGVLANPWGQWPTSSQYNVVAPAYPGQFYQQTLNAGAVWTWNSLVQDLWTQMPLLGPYPGLPVTPTGTPENYVFPGEGCWDALNHVLDHLGLTISTDLTQASPYGIVVPGAEDTNFTNLQTQHLNIMEEDYEYLDSGAARAPGGVFVFFHRANQFYGTEETVRRDNFQWQGTPLYSIFVTAPSPYNASPGQGYLWADVSVRYDVDGKPLAADVAAAQVVAQSLANAYYTRITRGTAGYLRQVYGGVLPFTAGSQVDGVRWFQVDGRAGWRTGIMRGPQPPWPEMHVEVAGRL